MRLNSPIDVILENGAPCRIRRGRRIYHVRRRLEHWIVQSRWWGREEKRHYFRLETDCGIIEVYRATEFVESGDRSEKAQRSKHSGLDRHSERDVHLPSIPLIPLRSISRPSASCPISHPLFIEGDTHTCLLRRTDSAYRPDAKQLNTSHSPLRPVRRHWVLSKIID